MFDENNMAKTGELKRSCA